MSIIKQIADLRIPTDSYISAVQNFNDRAREGQLDPETIWKALVGDAVKPLPQPYTRVQVAYLIQEVIRRDRALDTDIVVADAAETATRKAQEYVANHPWVFVGDQPEQKMDAEGNVVPTRKRGAKQEHAAQVFERMKGQDKAAILKAFIDEVGLTKAGAMTYYYNLRKQAA